MKDSAIDRHLIEISELQKFYDGSINRKGLTLFTHIYKHFSEILRYKLTEIYILL